MTAYRRNTRCTASFRLAGQDQRRSTVGRIVLQGRNAVNWNEPAAIASFIQPDDAPIKAFAREIGTRVAELAGSTGNAAQDPSLWLKMLASALHVRGLGWFADPLTPFAETSLVKGRADYLQLPRETLRFLGGDADEIAILLSSICEAAGLETSILFRPGLVLVAVRLGPGSPLAGHLRSLGGDSAPEWAVIDPARMPADLLQLLDAGAGKVDAAGSTGLQVVKIRLAWAAYPPAVLPDTSWHAQVPLLDELKRDAGFP